MFLLTILPLLRSRVTRQEFEGLAVQYLAWLSLGRILWNVLSGKISNVIVVCWFSDQFFDGGTVLGSSTCRAAMYYIRDIDFEG